MRERRIELTERGTEKGAKWIRLKVRCNAWAATQGFFGSPQTSCSFTDAEEPCEPERNERLQNVDCRILPSQMQGNLKSLKLVP